MAGGRVHVHRDDCPAALGVLGALFSHRLGAAADIGYSVTESGAFVDWDALERSWLSSTERAAVVVARGIALAERQGGWNPRIHHVIADAIARVGGGRR